MRAQREKGTCFWKLKELVPCYVVAESLSEVLPAQYVSD